MIKKGDYVVSLEDQETIPKGHVAKAASSIYREINDILVFLKREDERHGVLVWVSALPSKLRVATTTEAIKYGKVIEV